MGSTIDGATILTMDSRKRVIRDGAVHFDNGVIIDVGKSEEVKSRNRTTDLRVDARGMVLLPNLVNAHTHTFQTLRRGWGADLALTDWLRKVVWSLSNIITPDDMALGASISAVEAMKSGSTYLLDHTTTGTSTESAKRIADAYVRLGVKAGLAVGITERTKRAELWNIPRERFPYTLEESIKMVRDVALALESKKRSGISVWAGPVTIFSAGPEMFKAALKVCEEMGLRLHTHIAETQSEVESTLEDYSCREAEFLHRMGVLSERTTLAHCIWLDDHEIDLIARAKTSVVHNPISNMYLGSGMANVPHLLEKGVNVALGSDGGACGSSHDMLGVIKSAALLQKVRNNDPKAITSYQALEMATIGGARAVGMESSLGSIETGKSADFFLLDLRKTFSAPVGDVFSSIVYYATPTNVHTVFASGRPIVEGGRVLVADEEELREAAQHRADEIESRAVSH